MGKRQALSVTACLFLFLSLVSEIHCTTQTNSLNRLYRQKQSNDAFGNLNEIRRLSVPSLKQTSKENDLIEKLPGQPPVSFKQYGGYVSVNETAGRFLFYYFVEATKSNVSSSPLVIWFNGGPGCSSLGGGAFQEHGPFRVHSNGKTLFQNPYSWNNEANMLYVESPAPVGFSYSNTPLEKENHNDQVSAEHNYEFLLNWLKRFPEYKEREVYIAGQSYAGHYGPQLAQLILQRNNLTFINLRGLLIGNPGLNGRIEYVGNVQFLADHAMIPPDLFAEFKKFCGFGPNPLEDYNEKKCIHTTRQMNNNQKHVDMYNIYSPLCLNSTLTNKPKKCTTIMKFDPCSEHYVISYLNNKKVQEAIHANTTNVPYPWSPCNKRLEDVYNMQEYTEPVPILKYLMEEGVRVWVYSGDVDGMVSITGTLMVLKSMNLTVEKSWRPWFSEGEVGGYTEDYKSNLKFISVKGAGHSVPSDRPIVALTLFSSFIHNTSLPETI